MACIFIGCAGWTLPKSAAEAFPGEGSHLQRYAARFPAVEINSSFYRPHRPATYARWAESVPEDFRFSVKVPKQITHALRLQLTGNVLENFLGEVGELGAKLGCLLVQLPPSLAFDADVVDTFFTTLRDATTTPVVCEPRHATWFTSQADMLLKHHRIARVAADPARVPAAAQPGGYARLAYYRLHGSPRTYYSSYDDAYLTALAAQLRAAKHSTWCIFDNTALGAATHNALSLLERLR
jgi:uncharacterized protein YecE (DUF72 family)